MGKETLINTLKNDSEWEARRDAAEELREFDDEDVVDALVVAMQEDEKWVVRFKSADSLGEIGVPDAVDPLIEALQDPHSTVVSHVAEALGQIGDQRALDPLLSTLTWDQRDFSPCRSAGEALAELGEEAVRPVIRCLKDDDRRSGALVALEAMGDARATQPLVVVLTDRSVPLFDRVTAAEALGATSDPEAIEHLKAGLLEADNPKLVNAITQALQDLGSDPEALSGMKEEAETRATVQLLRNLRKVKIGMREEELTSLIGGPAFSMKASGPLGKRAPAYLQKRENWEYRTQFGSFQIVMEDGRVVKMGSVRHVIGEIEKEIPEELPLEKESAWWQFWK
ncbi:MAG: HEAT repeat domain-containing protein [Anaerolineae bacterium]|jgi:HEAT repeat protein